MQQPFYFLAVFCIMSHIGADDYQFITQLCLVSRTYYFPFKVRDSALSHLATLFWARFIWDESILAEDILAENIWAKSTIKVSIHFLKSNKK